MWQRERSYRPDIKVNHNTMKKEEKAIETIETTAKDVARMVDDGLRGGLLEAAVRGAMFAAYRIGAGEV